MVIGLFVLLGHREKLLKKKLLLFCNLLNNILLQKLYRDFCTVIFIKNRHTKKDIFIKNHLIEKTSHKNLGISY